MTVKMGGWWLVNNKTGYFSKYWRKTYYTNFEKKNYRDQGLPFNTSPETSENLLQISRDVLEWICLWKEFMFLKKRLNVIFKKLSIVKIFKTNIF